MIDEIFLRAAVNIKKRYIDLTGDLVKYEKRMQLTKDKLDDAIKKIEEIETAAKARKSEGSNELLNSLMKVLEGVDMEGQSIEKFVDPINKGIEELAIEETELYRRICEKHPGLTEEQIVESVRERLKKENLL